MKETLPNFLITIAEVCGSECAVSKSLDCTVKNDYLKCFLVFFSWGEGWGGWFDAHSF